MCCFGRLLPLWLLSNMLWPAAHAVNFRYVPTEQRVLFVNIVFLLWNVVTCQVTLRSGSIHHCKISNASLDFSIHSRSGRKGGQAELPSTD